MKILNTILEFKKTPYIIAGVIFLSSLVVLSCFKNAETQLNILNQAASLSRTMAKSSDDLTNYARYFVTTRNEHWRTEFNNVLKVRNGEMSDTKGIVKSFKDRVKEVPFSQIELNRLLKAEELSNNLAKLEVDAFALIDKGTSESKLEIQLHHYTEAQMLMFGDDYKKYKKEIVNTTDEFYTMVMNRLQSEYLFYMSAAWTMIIIINLNLILLVMLINHKEIVNKKPIRTVRKKPQIKRPAVKKN
jgi:hypothetical protein